MNTIPKKIHYCWFGGAPLDEKALHCIASWKKYFPDYEIIQWNETNFDIASCDFMHKAYQDGKWAFVSDVARLQVIYEQGGLYFDTDVEVIAPYDDILSSDSDGFMGFEKTNQVATGLGFGSIAGNPCIKMLLDIYEGIDYNLFKHDLSQIACTVLTTNLLTQHGLIAENKKQKVLGVDIYPAEYFSPLDYFTGRKKITHNTHSIHWYSASWKSDTDRANYKSRQRLYRILGRPITDTVSGIVFCINNEGFIPYLKKRLHKYFEK